MHSLKEGVSHNCTNLVVRYNNNLVFVLLYNMLCTHDSLIRLHTTVTIREHSSFLLLARNGKSIMVDDRYILWLYCGVRNICLAVTSHWCCFLLCWYTVSHVLKFIKDIWTVSVQQWVMSCLWCRNADGHYVWWWVYQFSGTQLNNETTENTVSY